MRFEGVPEPLQEILFDPQTSGGLLISVSEADAPELLKELESLELTPCLVGEVRDPADRNIVVY